MAVKYEGRSWKVLLLALAGTIVIWVLSNATPLFFDVLLEGGVGKTSAVSFTMGLYGVISGGLITILGEKIGFLDKSDYAKGQETRAQVDGLGTGMMFQSDDAKVRDELIEAKMEGQSTEELEAKYDQLQAEKEQKKLREELEAKQRELEALQSQLKVEAPNVATEPATQ